MHINLFLFDSHRFSDDSDEKTNAHSQPLHLVKQHRVTSQDSEGAMKFENIPIRNVMSIYYFIYWMMCIVDYLHLFRVSKSLSIPLFLSEIHQIMNMKKWKILLPPLPN